MNIFAAVSLLMLSVPVLAQGPTPPVAGGGNAAPPSASVPYAVPSPAAPVSTRAVSEQPVNVSTQPTAEQRALAVSTTAAAAKLADADTVSIGDGPWMVCRVESEGLVNVKEKVITKHVKAKKGEFYEQGDINKDIQALVGLGNFSKALVDITRMEGTLSTRHDTASYPCHKVIYRLTERPLVEDISFTGRKKISKGTLLDEMTLKEGDSYDEVKLIEDIRKIKDKYSEKGYINAKADFAAEPGPKKGTVSVKITVSEGAQARVKTAVFDGAAGYPQKKLIKETKNRPGKIYTPSDMAEDKKSVEAFYLNDGYYDFKITESSVTFNADQSEVYIRHTVAEGPKSLFGETAFSGNLVLKSTDLARAIEYKKGKIFKQERFDDTIRALQEKYADIGYLKASVKPQKNFNAATGALDVIFDIVENNVVYIDHVDVGGNKATKTYVLRREITVKEGDIFRSSKIRRSQEKLMNLGFLDDVAIDISPTADPDKVDLAFDVAEGKPGMLTLGASVSSVDGLFGDVSVQHMNLFGRAQKLALRWQFGARVLDYSVSWTTPWVKDKPISFGVDVYDTRRLRPYGTSTNAYTDHRVGGRLRLGPRFEDDKYQLNLAYSYEQVNVSNVQDIYQGLIMEGTSTTSKISAELAVDTRDNIWDPTRGWRNSVSGELSGGPLLGQVNLYKGSLASSFNYKLFSIGDYPLVWAFSNRFGLLGRYGGTADVPVYERYFLGGQDTIRGYDNNGQVGPPNGGTVFYVFNTELRFPIARERKRTIIQGAFFFDMGNDWNNLNDVSMQVGSSTNQLKTGAGFGIRFTTPAFPIRLDWGYGFNHKSGEQVSQLYFTIGNLF